MLIKKLTYNLPRKSLVTIFKAFLKPLIDYSDIIYDQPQNESFCEKIESVQRKATLTITSAIQDLQKAPNYSINLIPKYEPTIETRNSSIPSYKCRTNCFKHSFFPSDQNDWFELDINIRNSESIPLFKCRLLSFIRPVQNNIYNIFDSKGLKFLTRLRLGLSHLNAHRFRDNVQDSLNPLCSCSLETEDVSHYCTAITFQTIALIL